VGYTLIRAVRNVLGPDMPIIVLSGQNERQAIAHAVEMGANDFICKPLDRTILASEVDALSCHRRAGRFTRAVFSGAQGGSDASVNLIFELREVDEFGVKIVAKHLLNKGSVFRLDSPLLHESRVPPSRICLRLGHLGG